MASVQDVFCDVCQKFYKALDTAPKCLTCSHVFCSACVSNMTTTRLRCPKCKAIISVLSAEDIDKSNSIKKSLSISVPNLSTEKMNRDSARTRVDSEPAQEQRGVGLLSSSTVSGLNNISVPGDLVVTTNENNVNPNGFYSDENKSRLESSNITMNKKLSDNSISSNLHTVPQTDSSEYMQDKEEKERNEHRNLAKSEHGVTDIEQNDIKNPTFLVQECESSEPSDSVEVIETDNLQISEADTAQTDQFLHPPSVFLLGNSDSTLVTQIPDSVDQHYDQLPELLPKGYPHTSHLIQNQSEGKMHTLDHSGYPSDAEVPSSRDSTAVHRSNSCDLDHIPMISEFRGALTLDQDFRETREEELQKFTDQIQIMHEVVETVDEAVLTLGIERKQHEATKTNLLEMVLEEEERIKVSGLKIEEALEKKQKVQEATEVLKAAEEEIARSKSLSSLRDAVEKTHDSMIVAEKLGTKVEVQYMNFLLTRNVHKPEYLERMIDLGEQVFAEHQVDGHWRWCKVSLEDGFIYVHALTRMDSAPQGRILPWSCLKGMVSQEQATIFMDISLAGTFQGRVLMTLSGDNPRTEQFVRLSSGEHKYSYKGIRMKQLGNAEEPGEYVSFHGPKDIRGLPIRGVVHGISQGGVHTRDKLPGVLAGAALSHSQRTLFVIYLEPDPDEATTGAFGEVTQGLDVLRKVSKHKPVREVEIEDCGLVIPLVSHHGLHDRH